MDSIADMLVAIKNAQAVGKETVVVPYSKLKFSIADVLAKEGFLSGVEKKGKGPKKFIIMNLRYVDDRPAISSISRVSRQGTRIYIGRKLIRRVKQGYGMAILTTPAGILTGEEAKKKGVGGEVICEVW